MDRLTRSTALLLCVLAAACTEETDTPSRVRDLRVLGISVESPELMAPSCEPSPESLIVLGAEVTYRALIVDPRDSERTLDYALYACSSAPDAQCDPEEERVLLAEGTTRPGELVLYLRPGLTQLPDGTALLQRVQERDPYRGLGGVRMPLVLHLKAGEEQLWATKLMVFSCRLFPEMKQNETPRLPGLKLEGQPWPEEVVPQLRGPGPFLVEAEDVTALQEPYVVPNLELQPLALTETWEVAWYTTLGEFTREETGGTEASGELELLRTQWVPLAGAAEQEVRFWAVVRDGRGGMSWVERRVRWSP